MAIDARLGRAIHPSGLAELVGHAPQARQVEGHHEAGHLPDGGQRDRADDRPRVGREAGPQDVDPQVIEDLPERLEQAGIAVWVTYPRTVREGAELLAELATLGASAERAHEVVGPVLAAVEAAESRPALRRPRVFCPIWRNPWMTLGRDTYAHDLIRLCGGENVFAERGDRRYPLVSEEDIVRAAPEVVLLPDEPYRFDERDARELQGWDLPAGRERRIHLIDGTWVSWYGPRIRGAIETLRGFFEWA